jgi:hypothetical protein
MPLYIQRSRFFANLSVELHNRRTGKKDGTRNPSLPFSTETSVSSLDHVPVSARRVDTRDLEAVFSGEVHWDNVTSAEDARAGRPTSSMSMT